MASERADWKKLEDLVFRAMCGQRVVMREGTQRREMFSRALIRYIHPEWEKKEWIVHPFGSWEVRVDHIVSGGSACLMKPDMTREFRLAGGKFPGVKEICFGCGATRLVDLEPMWKHKVMFHGIERRVTLCNACGSAAAKNMHESGVESLDHMSEFEDAIDRRPWLADHAPHFTLCKAVATWRQGIAYAPVPDRSGLDR